MPQEFHVLRCVTCDTFQVHIAKKVLKWTCKICQKKQSVLQEFARGTGKECRLVVQRLNEQRLRQDNLPAAAPALMHNREPPVGSKRADCKWNKYLDKSEESAEEELDQDTSIEDMGPVRKQRNCGQRSVEPEGCDVDPPKAVAADRNIAKECEKEDRPKSKTGVKRQTEQVTGLASKWAKYVDLPDKDDSSTEETFDLDHNPGNVDEQDLDLDELLKF